MYYIHEYFSFDPVIDMCVFHFF